LRGWMSGNAVFCKILLISAGIWEKMGVRPVGSGSGSGKEALLGRDSRKSQFFR
jgi:hypothetical protein